MINFLKINKNLITYSSILLIVISLFGFNNIVSLFGNLLLLLFLIPLLLILIILIGLNSFKSKIKTCYQCGSISFGNDNTCMNCGADLSIANSNNLEEFNKASKTTIEIKAEEIK